MGRNPEGCRVFGRFGGFLESFEPGHSAVTLSFTSGGTTDFDGAAFRPSRSQRRFDLSQTLQASRAGVRFVRRSDPDKPDGKQ